MPTIHTILLLQKSSIPLFFLLCIFSAVFPQRVLSVSNSSKFCKNLPHSGYLSANDLMRACRHRDQWLRDMDRQQEDRIERTTDSQKDYLQWLESTRAWWKVPKPEQWEDAVTQHEGDKFRRRKRQQQQVNDAIETNEAGEEATNENAVNILVKDSSNPGQGGGTTARGPNGIGRKFVRKEYRLMSDQERQGLHQAFAALKNRHIDNISIWDLHTLVHYPNSAPGAHWGPAFLPWHREFLRQFEMALQNEVPDLVGLPYWDSTLDNGLPDPADSVLWSQELLGNGNGFVRNGPFKDWDTNVLMPLSPVPIKRLFRSAGGRAEDRLMSTNDVEWILGRRNFSELTFCHDKTFESMHGLSHVWVGGFMFVIRVSPNDPTFYLHHAFIDYLWEQFRQRNQDRLQRETDWAEKICDKKHALDAPMKPFHLRNRDGLSNDYTDHWYEYEAVRHCKPDRPLCDSRFLFCDKIAWRCRSRIQLGGNCTGFVGTEICHDSICIKNVCRLPATEGSGFERREHRPVGVVWAKSLMLADETRPLISGIAHVTVRHQRDGQQANGENYTAFLERNPAYPETMGLLYLPLPNPKNSNADYNVTLEASDHYGRYCQSYCLNATTQRYQICEPILTMRSRLGGADGKSSSNISFTHQFVAREFLDMDISTHPEQWKVSLPASPFITTSYSPIKLSKQAVQVFNPFMVFACQKKTINSTAVNKIVDAQIASITEAMNSGSDHVWFRVGLLKKAGSKSDLDELQIEAEDVNDSNDVYISSVRHARSAYDESVVFVRARNPFQHPNGVEVHVSVRQKGIRIKCDVRCNHEGNLLLDDCGSQVRLHSVPEMSQEQVFSSATSHLPYLGWRMIGHPSEWRLRMPFLSLYC